MTKKYYKDVFLVLQTHVIDKQVLDEAIRLRKAYKMKLGDSIVAATALLNSAEIYTRNVADFEKIPGLAVVNPVLQMEQSTGIKPLLILTIFLLFLFLSAYLFWNSLSLYYPFGYKTNTFVYIAFITTTIIYLKSEGVFEKAFRTGLSCSFIFYLVFMLTGGAILSAVFDGFDFDDETVFLNDQYRIVTTSEVIHSGGQSYIALLLREGITEHCIYRSGMRRWENPRIIIEGSQVGLVARSEDGSRMDTIWIESSE